MRWLGALAQIQIVAVESSKFERHLGTILPIIENQTAPEKYEQVGLEFSNSLMYYVRVFLTCCAMSVLFMFTPTPYFFHSS